MENKEMFGGIGRTWLMSIGTMVLTTAMFIFGLVPLEAWEHTVEICLGAGTVKSTVVGLVQAWKAKINEPKEVKPV